MPSRNVIKQYTPDSYYHVYNRGVGKQPIFIDDRDREYFLKLVRRYLSPANEDRRSDGNSYPTFETDLLCYCLMGNHFHMVFYIAADTSAVSEFMRSLTTAYTMYFNLRHDRAGHLFQGVYKAAPITSESYLMHISRYIHLNPARYKYYAWSSVSYYLGVPAPDWLHPARLLSLVPDYEAFLKDYESYKAWLEASNDQDFKI